MQAATDYMLRNYVHNQIVACDILLLQLLLPL